MWRDDWTDMACRGCTRAKNAVLSPSAVQKQLQASTVWMDGDMDVCMYSMYVCMYEGTPVRYGTVRKVCIDYAHARLMCSLQGANALTDGVES